MRTQITRTITAKEKGMLVSNWVRSSTIVAFLTLGLAACSDGLTAPQSPGLAPGDALMAKGSGKGGSGSSGSGSSGSGGGQSGRGQVEGTRTFTIYPGIPVFEKFGEHFLTMPANVVCDPAKAEYGAAFFDTQCARLLRPIQVTAKWGVVSGRPVLSFSPDLRFAPSKQEQEWVKLTIHDTKSTKPELYYTILWYDLQAKRWVDESQADPTLKATVSPVGNFVTRRLKHFSDYYLWVGLGSYNVTSGMGGEFWGGW
jgi:hypothetical protein